LSSESTGENAPRPASSSGSFARPRVRRERAHALLDLGLERTALVARGEKRESYASRHEQGDDERAELDLKRSQKGSHLYAVAGVTASGGGVTLPPAQLIGRAGAGSTDDSRRCAAIGSFESNRADLEFACSLRHLDAHDVVDRLPSSARAIGEEIERRPLAMSDSSSPTSV
jgi:hypothetical protein